MLMYVKAELVSKVLVKHNKVGLALLMNKVDNVKKDEKARDVVVVKVIVVKEYAKVGVEYGV